MVTNARKVNPDRSADQQAAQAAYLAEVGQRSQPLYHDAADILSSLHPWAAKAAGVTPIDTDIQIPHLRAKPDYMDRDLFIDQVIEQLELRNGITILDPYDEKLRAILYGYYVTANEEDAAA